MARTLSGRKLGREFMGVRGAALGVLFGWYVGQNIEAKMCVSLPSGNERFRLYDEYLSIYLKYFEHLGILRFISAISSEAMQLQLRISLKIPVYASESERQQPAKQSPKQSVPRALVGQIANSQSNQRR